ncbi:hypothetical protein FA13DRAFT_1699812 [Coprinellus micaceus]|uniref:Uncharacterized protein n=1 Tax=Coprinellus micaceus TaxID=71717 RepID=A0A4Y7S9Q6_COPMI|nr:hypothetical protein FA13DRAFT_1699812 [Coprinellus micaceus]
MSTQPQPAPTLGADSQPQAKPKRNRIRTKRRRATTVAVNPEESDALTAFFERFGDRGFVYDPEKRPTIEFSRLNRELEIEKYSTESKDIWKAFGKAMAAQFGIKFGKNVNDLRAWQRLCKRIGIEPLPTTLEDARAKFKETHVNIVELLTPRIKDGEMETFETEEALAIYSCSTPGLIYPRKFVTGGSLLWYLLRHILTPVRE